MLVRCGVVFAMILSFAAAASAAGDSNTYKYDNYGRLQSITYANGTVVYYYYDNAGNRTSVVTTCSSGGC